MRPPGDKRIVIIKKNFRRRYTLPKQEIRECQKMKKLIKSINNSDYAMAIWCFIIGDALLLLSVIIDLCLH